MKTKKVIYHCSSLGAILSGEDDIDTPQHAKADDMTLQDTVDSLLKASFQMFSIGIMSFGHVNS